MKDYTVIGYYEDNLQTFSEYAKATSACKAIHKACKKLNKGTGRDKANIAIVAVLNGRAVWAADWDTFAVCSAVDVPKG